MALVGGARLGLPLALCWAYSNVSSKLELTAELTATAALDD